MRGSVRVLVRPRPEVWRRLRLRPEVDGCAWFDSPCRAARHMAVRYNQRVAASRGECVPGGRELGLFPVCALPLRGVEDLLAKANDADCHFHVLVLGDEFDGLFKRHVHGRLEDDGVICAGGADVRQMLGARGVDRHVAEARVFADDHALIDLVAGADEQPAALLKRVERVGGGDAGFHRDQRAGVAGPDLAGIRGRIP